MKDKIKLHKYETLQYQVVLQRFPYNLKVQAYFVQGKVCSVQEYFHIKYQHVKRFEVV